MKHQRLTAIARTSLRGAPLFCFGVCAAGALAYTVHGTEAASGHHKRSAFTLVASPRSRSVTAGATAQYQIVIHRGRYRGKIRVTAAGSGLGLLPDRNATRAGNTITLKPHGQRVLMTVRTSASDRAGRYSVRVRAVGGKHRAYLSVGLTITVPAPAAFAIAGNFGPLWPGRARAVDLALTNPNSQAISVQTLTVSIKQVSAPRATHGFPCSIADFSVIQFAGAFPLEVPANATTHLSSLGVPPARRPQLVMLNRPINQNGCQGATLTLSYSGTATSP